MLEKIIGKKYKIAIYIRLSKEDADKGYDESESITNQKSLLTDYVQKLGSDYELIDLYIDPGFTGTNFNRPDFKRMINDINLGKINMVVTKDLSRLGRDYIETGEYIEKWFPEKNVRYVSVNDGIDTFAENNGNNDIAPFKSILNDMYSKDLSKKIKTALHTMQAQGKWVGSSVALGYQRDPNDKNKLIICEEEAKIIRLIFDMAYNGKKASDIKNYLNQNDIPTTSRIRYNRATHWEAKAVKNILTNQIYIGISVQNKRSRINYKNRKLRANPQEQWYIVENTHESIIDRKKFEAIQKMKIAQNYTRNEKKNHFLLDGLLICYECKHKIGVRKGSRAQMYMVCNNYRRFSKFGVCTSHGFSYQRLEEMVLNYLKNLFFAINQGEIELKIKNSKTKRDYKKMQEQLKQEMIIINNHMDNMYLDKLNGKISGEMYERLVKKLQTDLKAKETEYRRLEEEKNNGEEDDIQVIQKVIEDFLDLKKPTPELMRTLINRIELHQDKQVDIVFNFRKLNDISVENCIILEKEKMTDKLEKIHK